MSSKSFKRFEDGTGIQWVNDIPTVLTVAIKDVNGDIHLRQSLKLYFHYGVKWDTSVPLPTKVQFGGQVVCGDACYSTELCESGGMVFTPRTVENLKGKQ